MTPKFQCGATCTKGPDHEMLACESTTPCCNPHLEDKPTVGKQLLWNLSNKDEWKTRLKNDLQQRVTATVAKWSLSEALKLT